MWRRAAYLGWLALAGCEPKGIAHASCESVMLATGEPWQCRISGPSIDQAVSIHFDTESRNQVAQVQISLRVTEGALRIGYRDLEGDKLFTLTPSTPFVHAMRTRMHREHRSFTLAFDPQPPGSKVRGLTGSVSYSTP